MSMKKVAAMVGGAVLAAGLSVAIAAPASAATSDCPSGNSCVWKDADYQSDGWGADLVRFVNGIRDFSGYTWASGITLVNNVTSMYNNGNSQYSYLFYDPGFVTQAASFPLKTGLSNLGVANDATRSAGFAFCVNNPTSSLCI